MARGDAPIRDTFGRASMMGLLLVVFGTQGCAVAHEMKPIADGVPVPEQVFDDPGQEHPSSRPPPVRFYGPTDSHGRMMLDRWRRVLGPTVLITNPAPGMAAPEPGDSLAVFVWNIDVGAGNLPKFLEEELGYSCPFQGEAPHFVILVQEAGRRLADPIAVTDPDLASKRRTHPPNPRGDPDIVGVARMCGLALAFVPSGRNGADVQGDPSQDKGNAVLSTLPLSDLFAIEGPFETERKVTLGVTVGEPDYGILRVLSAHLEVTSGFFRTFTTGNRTRLGQALGILEALAIHEAAEPRSMPTIIGGDFNTWSGMDSALKAFREAFPDYPEWDGQDTMGPFPTDHIFFRRSDGGGADIIPDTYRRIESTHSSDHHSRVVWVRLGGLTRSTR